MKGDIIMNRRGEKIGWTGGWIGGFLWVFVFAITWLIQGRLIHGLIAVALFFFGIISIIKFSPWKYPDTKYWKLMIPMYSVFLISAVFIVYALNGFENLAKIQYGLWILPCLSPIMVLGNKKWNK